jgi:hypothetical protein
MTGHPQSMTSGNNSPTARAKARGRLATVAHGGTEINLPCWLIAPLGEPFSARAVM